MWRDIEAIIPICGSIPHSIMHASLYFPKIRARLIFQQLIEKHEKNRLGLYLQYLLQYATEGENILNRIISCDGSSVHQYQPESRRTSMQWKHPFSLSSKKLKVTSSAVKATLSVFSDCKGVVLAEFTEKGETVNVVTL